MKISHLAMVALLASVATGSAAFAQSSSSKVAPAEYPPASFNGTQYVDSRGCVYIRAGTNGNVSWVPRLTRKRQHICGQQPSKVAGASQLAPARSQKKVVQITLEPETQAVQTASIAPRSAPSVQDVAAKPVRTAAVVRPKPTRLIAKKSPVTPAAAAAPATATVKQNRSVIAPSVVSKAVPKPVAAQSVATKVARKPVPVPKPVAVQKTAVAAPKSAIRKPVRRKVVKPVATVAPTGPVPSTSLPGSTRVLPRHLANDRANRPNFAVPKGYRPAWEDDRLNPRRAEGTLAGRTQMNLVWTTGVPRRLIDRSSGRDMTAKVALVYPYTDFAAQKRDLGTVTLITKNGQTMKRIVRKSRAKPVKAVAKTKPVVASRSAATRGESLSGTRYVQVGTFGVQRNAQATAAQMKRLGLPVRIGKFSRSGKTLRLVLAGPFPSDTSANQALSTVRNSGFSDAFLRK